MNRDEISRKVRRVVLDMGLYHPEDLDNDTAFEDMGLIRLIPMKS